MSLPSANDVKLWLALLHELSAAPGGQLQPRQASQRLVQYFPQITHADLAGVLPSGSNRWHNRVQWVRQRLVARGLLDPGSKGVWAITDDGRQWANAQWIGPDADYRGLSVPPRMGAPAATSSGAAPKVPAAQQSSGVAPPPQTKTGVLVQLQDPVDLLWRRVQQTQRLNQHPEQFEHALGDAFAFLGFDVRQLGGKGDTDLLVSAPLGADGYRAVVDAKTSGAGRVGQGHINWLVLQQHQQSHQADYIMVVAEGFADGNVRTFATQVGVALLKTADLSDLLRLHDQTACSLLELREVFKETGVVTQSMAGLRTLHQTQLRRWRLLFEVLREAQDQVRYGGAGLTIRPDVVYASLLRSAITQQVPANEMPSLDEVGAALRILASRAVGALAETAGAADTYRLTMSVPTARRRLAQLARVFDAATAVSGIQSTKPANSSAPPGS